MASPQCEDGFTKIANELLDALIKTNFSGYQRRVLDTIIRKTYGFNKKEDYISYSQIIEMTDIRMPHVSRALKELKQRRIVTKGGNKIGINKDYSQWQKLPKGVSSHHELPKGVTTVTKGGFEVTKGGKKKLPKGGDTKDTLKDTITKETIKRKIEHDQIVTKGGNKNPNVKKFIDYYHNSFLEKFGAKPKINGSKDGQIIKDLLGTYNFDELKELLNRFFKSTDPFILQSGYTIGVFTTQINKLIITKKGGRKDEIDYSKYEKP